MNFKEKVGIQKSNPEADLDINKTALIDGSIPLMHDDNVKCAVPTGLDVGYDNQYAVVNSGIGYNKKRVHIEGEIRLKLTNTGVAHNEDAIINSHGELALTLDINNELTPYLYLGTVSVDASGNGTGASGGPDRSLYLHDEESGSKKLGDILTSKSCASIYNSADQGSLGNGWSQVTLDKVNFDELGEADVANNQIVVSASGYYYVAGCVRTSDDMGNNNLLIAISINGADAIPHCDSSGSGDWANPSTSTIYKLNTNDALGLYIYNSLSTDITLAANYSVLTAKRVM